MSGKSAKSHQYYYYMCNKNHKQGKEACNARAIPKDRLEQLVINQIKEKILTQECLEELVELVNEELDVTHSLLNGRLDAIQTEISDITNRLCRLYDALETGKVVLNDLATRIKELRAKENELSNAKIQLEAEMVAEGVETVDADSVKNYAEDLRNVLDEIDSQERKAFLRSFVKRLVIEDEKAVVHYKLPMPPDGKRKQKIEVLPIDTLGGAEGTRTS